MTCGDRVKKKRKTSHGVCLKCGNCIYKDHIGCNPQCNCKGIKKRYSKQDEGRTKPSMIYVVIGEGD